jgi:hypothetical protein
VCLALLLKLHVFTFVVRTLYITRVVVIVLGSYFGISEGRVSDGAGVPRACREHRSPESMGKVSSYNDYDGPHACRCVR